MYPTPSGHNNTRHTHQQPHARTNQGKYWWYDLVFGYTKSNLSSVWYFISLEYFQVSKRHTDRKKCVIFIWRKYIFYILFIIYCSLIGSEEIRSRSWADTYFIFFSLLDEYNIFTLISKHKLKLELDQRQKVFSI